MAYKLNISDLNFLIFATSRLEKRGTASLLCRMTLQASRIVRNVPEVYPPLFPGRQRYVPTM